MVWHLTLSRSFAFFVVKKEFQQILILLLLFRYHFLFMINGCSTVEKQTPELIRSWEPVLFEGTATFGRWACGRDPVRSRDL
jgi:hypothetical protein